MIPPELRQQILDQERLVAEVQKIRAPSKKTWWESTGLTAMLTAIATVAVTSVGSYLTQQSLNRRAVGIAEHRTALERRRDAMERSYKALGLVMRGTYDRLLMAQGYYDDAPRKLRTDLLDETNRIDREWRQERGQYELEMHLLFGGDTNVSVAWTKAKASVEAYVLCVEQTYEKNVSGKAPESACRSDSTTAATAVRSLLDRYEQHYTNADSLGR